MRISVDLPRQIRSLAQRITNFESPDHQITRSPDHAIRYPSFVAFFLFGLITRPRSPPVHRICTSVPNAPSATHAHGSHAMSGAGFSGYTTHGLPAAAARNGPPSPINARLPMSSVHAPAKAVPMMITYRCSHVATTAPATEARITTAGCGSPSTWVQIRLTRSAPMPAPTSATPTKYAASRTPAPISPPTNAPINIGVVSAGPKNELAASTPTAKPNIPSTILKRR